MKTIFLIITAILTLKVMGQVKSEFSQEYEPAKKLKYKEVIGGNNDSFYIDKLDTKGKDETYYIQKIDRKTFIGSEALELDLKEKEYEVDLKRLIVVGEELMAFVVKKHKKSDELFLSVIILDAATLSKKKEVQLEKSVETFAVDIKRNSNNKTALVILNYFKSDLIEFIVYDFQKSNTIATKKVSIDKSSFENIKDGFVFANFEIARELHYNADFEIDDENNIYLVYSGKNINSTKNNPIYETHYVFYDFRKNVITDKIINNDLLFDLRDPTISILSNKNVIISFCYSELINAIDIIDKGFMHVVIDNVNSKVISKKFYTLKEIFPNGDTENSSGKIKFRYTIDESFSFGNYSIVIGHKVDELMPNYAWYYKQGIQPNRSTSTELSDHFIEKIDQDGKVLFHKRLPFSSLLFSGPGHNYMVRQYASLVKGNYLYFFHAESPKTTTIIDAGDKTTPLSSVWNSAKNFVCNKINLEDGSITRTIIEIPEKNKYTAVMEPNYSIIHGPDTKIYDVYGNNICFPIRAPSNKERFLKVTLD